MTELTSHFQFANGVMCLLLALQFMAMPSLRPIPKGILGVNLLLYAHQSFILVAVLSGHFLDYAMMRPAIAMLLGPVLYLYFLSVKRPTSVLYRKDFIHLLIGVLLFLVLYFVRPLRALIDTAILLSFISYFLLILFTLKNGKQALTHLEHHANSAYKWLFFLMSISFINISLEIAVVIELNSGVTLKSSVSLFVASCAFFILNVITMLAVLYRSQYIEWMYQIGEQILPRTSNTLDEQLARSLFERWEELVQKEALHKLEFGITLTQAAKKLQVPARQLSNAINQCYEKSFSIYLNDQRINEVKKLLETMPDISIITVMQESGFSSKSNFNKEFLRVTGTSPSAYRESL